MTEHLYKSAYELEDLLLEGPERGKYDHNSNVRHIEQHWLEFLDVNVFDTNHIERILKDAFEEWFNHMITIPSLQGAIFSIYGAEVVYVLLPRVKGYLL